MGNKKVLIISPASVFSRYLRARNGMLSLVGVFTDDRNSGKNKYDFSKLRKL